MKKHLTALLLAAMILSLASCATPEPPAAPSLTANQRYTLEKLNQVNDMVLARETVPADYLRYLPDDLAELVEEYNNRTGELRVRFTCNAKSIVHGLLYNLDDRTPPREYEYPELYCMSRAAVPTGCGLCPATSMRTGMFKRSRIISA